MSKVRRFRELATGEEWTLSYVVALTATLARKDETRNVTLVRLATEYKEVEP